MAIFRNRVVQLIAALVLTTAGYMTGRSCASRTAPPVLMDSPMR
jgi:hypothetical protein